MALEIVQEITCDVCGNWVCHGKDDASMYDNGWREYHYPCVGDFNLYEAIIDPIYIPTTSRRYPLFGYYVCSLDRLTFSIILFSGSLQNTSGIVFLWTKIDVWTRYRSGRVLMIRCFFLNSCRREYWSWICFNPLLGIFKSPIKGSNLNLLGLEKFLWCYIYYDTIFIILIN